MIVIDEIDTELDITLRYRARMGGNSSRLCDCVQDILSPLGEGDRFWYLSLSKLLDLLLTAARLSFVASKVGHLRCGSFYS